MGWLYNVYDIVSYFFWHGIVYKAIEARIGIILALVVIAFFWWWLRVR